MKVSINIKALIEKMTLEEKLGFNGVVISDYSSVSELHISRNSGR